MANLLSLPAEILLLILSYFHPSEDVNVLLNLCLTAKKLCTLAQPLIFCEYPRKLCCHHCQKPKLKAGRIGPLICFTRTLVLRPELGARVRRMLITAWDEEADTLDGWSTALQPESIKTFARAVQRLTIKDKTRVLSGIVATETNPLLVLLISQTPNLEELELISGEEGLKLLGPLFLPGPRGVVDSPYLSKLKSLCIIDRGSMRDTSMKNLTHLMCLPQLDDFTLVNCDGHALGCPSFDITPGSLSITSLSLFEASLDSEALSKIVRACKSLRSFIYTASECDSHHHNCQVQPSQLVSILGPHKSSLEVVRINLDFADRTMYCWDECPQYDSFVSFTSLKHLGVEQGLIQDVTTLPTSLESIQFCLCDYPVVDMMATLTEQSNTRLQLLELVVLQPKYDALNGLLGLSGMYRNDDGTEHSRSCRARLLKACRRLERVVQAVNFDFHIHNSIWDDYMEGEL
ncbi:hypothetical protein BO78DRAFT_443377 [Aspergillus sclerotiicarbonarius CBS 121057]|uniref:Leucine-rich repeat domain-containing protein n=1 Tax=Aspergillus sclerotiicarbonarius (strain CBS 121057 / IBT 28362) TaxID=1448318 RepID=A0A319EYH4_ASPSB|nr:hypothetical protein BO78DRAFT_443377 [Aspergillus sclerotiicarbonarius CBS 121057]